jgi:cytochrome c oxidase subunit 1
MIAREKIARQYLVIGGLLFVLGFGAKFYLKWHLLPGSPAHSEMNAMHGTVIVFFGIVPMAFASLGYYLMPIGRDVQMAFPRLDSIGLWLFYCSAIIALAALMVPANSILIGALAVNLAFVIVCCVNFVATLIRVRTVSWWQMRSLVWALFALSSASCWRSPC